MGGYACCDLMYICVMYSVLIVKSGQCDFQEMQQLQEEMYCVVKLFINQSMPGLLKPMVNYGMVSDSHG